MNLSSITTVWPHDGRPADLVRALKYRRRTAAVSVIADRIAPLVPAVDVVTWCPAAPANRASRGFDQAELVARAVAARLRVPARRLLVRSRGEAQTGRDAAGRRLGPRLRARRLPPHVRVLVVDDVVTTGATLDAAAVALRRAGAAEVHAATATRAERRAMGTIRDRGVRSRQRPQDGGTSWTSPSAHGT